MPEPTKWRRFEDLIATIQRDLAPQNAIVTQNEHVLGRHSKVMRQIDVSVRIPTEAGQLHLILDAKDHSEKLDVKDVEAFLGLVEDVGANKGAIVSPLGFTPAAQRRAEAAGANAWTAIDVESTDWPAYASIPVLLEQRSPMFRFTLASNELREIAVASVPTLPLVDGSGGLLGTPISLAAKLWESERIDPDDDREQHLPLHDHAAFVQTEQGLARVQVDAAVRVVPRYYFGHLPLTQLRGFASPDLKTVRTRRFKTGWLVFREVEEKWQVLSAPDELSVQPLLHLVTAAVLEEDPTVAPTS